MSILIKHVAPGGKVFTRRSARLYTHVVMRRHNVQAHIASIQAGRQQEVERSVTSATDDWDHYARVRQVGVGGRVPFQRNQPGFGRVEGQEVHDYMVRGAQEYLEEYKTLENCVAQTRTETNAAIDRRIENVTRFRTDEFVVSWHQSRALAMKALDAHIYPGDVSRIEEVNNGMRTECTDTSNKKIDETLAVPRWVYVYNMGGFWRLTGAEWIALCQGKLANPDKAYELPDHRLLKRKPRDFRRHDDGPEGVHTNQYCPPPWLRHNDSYVEPYDWEADAFSEWLETHGITAKA